MSAAYYLALEGVRVVLIDRGDFGQEASWAGAGILPPASAGAASDGFEQLHQLSLAEFPKLSANLLRQTGIDNGYRVCGGLEFLAAQPAATQANGVELESDRNRSTQRLPDARNLQLPGVPAPRCFSLIWRRFATRGTCASGRSVPPIRS